MSAADEQKAGPGESFDFPTQLEAHVVDANGGRPRIHGFDVHRDLARAWTFAESLLMTLTGEEPGATAGRVLDIVLIHLLPRSVAEAPVHAALLAKLTAGRATAVLAVAGIGLAEEAAARVAAHAALLGWLETRAAALPVEAVAQSPAERAAVGELRTALAAVDLGVAERLPHDVGHAAALLLVLHTLGLRHAWQLEAIVTLAGLPALAAEAARVKQYALRSYPFNLPNVVYDPEAAP
jgi:hypothetical protein